MAKKKFIKMLDELKGIFSGDDDTNELIDELREKVQHKKSFENNSSEAHAGELPVPKELKQNVYDFAIYSDGACRGNPGPGAWGVIGMQTDGEILYEATGIEVRTTNNVMELEAAIQGLKNLLVHIDLLDHGADYYKVVLFSDSKYVVDGITSWVDGWKKRGWKKADKKTPENLDYWQELDELKAKFGNIEFRWVKGHSGHPQNDYVDKLANMALDDAGF